jgi:hypothetical protein
MPVQVEDSAVVAAFEVGSEGDRVGDERGEERSVGDVALGAELLGLEGGGLEDEGAEE